MGHRARPREVLTRVLLLLLLLRLASSSASGGSVASDLGQEAGELLAPCLLRNASCPWACLREESLAAVQRFSLAPRIALLDGVSLVRAGPAGGHPDIAGTGGKHGLPWSRSVLGALRRLLETHVLEIDPAPLPHVRATDLSEGRNRRRQQMIPMMIFGVTVFGMFVVPIAFQFLTALSGKAFLMAKLALLLASINGLKRVASTGVHYGLYHAVDHYPPSPHHPAPPLHHPHFGGGLGLYERTDAGGYAEGPRGAGDDRGAAGGLAPFFRRLTSHWGM